MEKIDIYNIVPELSCIIEKSERNLEHTILKVIRPTKILQERAVSPMDQTLIKQTLEITTIDGNESKFVENSKDGDISPTDSLLFGNLLVNIDNIKENRTLLTGFQKELTKINADIKECAACKNLIDKGRNGNRANTIYCNKHCTYYPLLKMDDVGSANDQISVIENLKTEILLEKEMKEQKEKISKLVQDLQRAKLAQNMHEIKAIEAALEFSKSYLNNLQMKQTNERLLNEQQQHLRTERFRNLPEKRVHETPDSVRNENKNIRSRQQRLNIQKMPPIEIRKSLQLQTNLTLSIPPGNASQDISRNNVIYETIVSNWEENDYRDRHQGTGICTKITNKTNIREQKPYSYSKTLEHDLCQEVPDKLESSKTEKVGLKMKETNEMTRGLGPKISVGTQCDSITLNKRNEVIPLNETTSAETQTAVITNDSNYLFGFREYLLKNKPNLSEESAVSVSVQASLAESNESMANELKSNNDRTSSVSAPVKNSIVSNMQKNSEYQGLAIMMAPVSSETDFKATEQITSKSREDNILNEFAGKRLHTVERAPSLRKMFLPPNEDILEIHQKVKIIDNNPKKDHDDEIRDNSSPKEEHIEPIPEKGDIFYKSLITEELPDRKLMTPYDSHVHVKNPQEEPIQGPSFINSLQSDKEAITDTKRSNDSQGEINNSITEVEENYILSLVDRQFSDIGLEDGRNEYQGMKGVDEIENNPVNSFFVNQISSTESILESKTKKIKTLKPPSLGENTKPKLNFIAEDNYIVPDESDVLQKENSGGTKERLTSDSESLWAREMTDIEKKHKGQAHRKILDKKVSIDEKFLGGHKSFDTMDTNELPSSNNEEKEKALGSSSQKSYRVETYKNPGKFILGANFPWQKPILIKKSDKLHEDFTHFRNKRRTMTTEKSNFLEFQTNTPKMNREDLIIEDILLFNEPNNEIKASDAPNDQLLDISVSTANPRMIMNIAEERQEYSRKCAKIKNIPESHSIGTSEGEVECKDFVCGISKNSTQHLEQSVKETRSRIPLNTQRQRYRQYMIQNSTNKSYGASSSSSAESAD